VNPDRIPCVVPFCRRTAARAKMPDASEIICGKCGRRAPRERAFYRALQRDMKGKERKGMLLNARGWRRMERGWERFKAAVIMAAAP
jgi:hypothetical protein